MNRGCFLLVITFENGSDETRELIKQKLKKHIKLLEKQSTQGAKILLKKITSWMSSVEYQVDILLKIDCFYTSVKNKYGIK